MSWMTDNKPIRRSDLHSDDSSPSPIPEDSATDAIRALLNKQFGSLEDIEDFAPAEVENWNDDVAEEEEDTGFRLFASQDPATKIDLGIPEVQGNGGFTLSERQKSYYIAEDLSPEDWARLSEVAVDGAEVLARARSRWAGCALPWKVTTALHGPMLILEEPKSILRKRASRKGKKARIAARKILRRKEEQEEQARLAAVEKEAYLREKKTAENRKKQLKKRAKEKAKKAETAG